ncbi:VWA domain-containing protein [bacterium]|nr:VWA domain-containing protein [bacterium]
MKKQQPKILFIGLILFIFFIAVPASAQSGIEVVVHYIEGEPAVNEIGYDVSVYVSLYDGTGSPIENVGDEVFSVTEDSTQVELDSVASAADAPVHTVLVLDTSGSMMGERMETAKASARGFIQSMKQGDMVAALTFDNEPETIFEFTDDTSAAANAINNVDANPNGGTCLYDAMYEAVQLAATLPAGRRAIIILTDGTDELTPGVICSSHTLDDVIDISSTGATRVPIYTIGLGSSIESRNLERVSQITGGRFELAQNTQALQDLFSRLARQLKNQYVLKYRSSSGPGSHTIAVRASYNGASDQDTRNFLLPGLPATVAIASPAPFAEVSGETKISANVIERGLKVKAVIFKVNDAVIGSVSEPPFEVLWNPSASTSDKNQYTVSVVVEHETSVLISEDHVSVTLTADAPDATPTHSIIEATEDAVVVENEITEQPSWLIPALIGAALIMVVIILVVVFQNKRKKEEKGDSQHYSDGDVTMDGISPGGAAISGNAHLIVEASDDPQMINQKVSLLRSPFTLGRSADNDLCFPKDTPVSRAHAIIEEQNGQFFLKESIRSKPDGTVSKPTYGTMLNGRSVDGSVKLFDGDEIMLGKRVKLIFHNPDSKSSFDPDDMTFDDFSLGELDEDATQDG